MLERSWRIPKPKRHHIIRVGTSWCYKSSYLPWLLRQGDLPFRRLNPLNEFRRAHLIYTIIYPREWKGVRLSDIIPLTKVGAEPRCVT